MTYLRINLKTISVNLGPASQSIKSGLTLYRVAQKIGTISVRLNFTKY